MEEMYPVDLYVYDLTKGLAAAFSQMLLGKKIDGVWHTAIVVYGREYFFGSGGIESCNPGETVLGAPQQAIRLGDTHIPYAVFKDYITGLGASTFRGSAYHLFRHNCNNFSDELAQFLCGLHIPKYILDLPNEVLQSSIGPIITGLEQRLERSGRPIADEQSPIGGGGGHEASPDFDLLNHQIEEARYNSQVLEESRDALREKIARRERRKERKRKKLLRKGQRIPPELQVATTVTMADTEAVNGGTAAEEEQLPTDQALQFEAEERRAEEERKRAREPPIVFGDAVDSKAEYESLVSLLDGKLPPDEKQSLDELGQYMMGDEGSWVVGDGFLNFVGRILNDADVEKDIRVHLLNVLAAAALKDDVILVLHQDRKDHVLMNYAYEIDRVPVEEQLATALFIANMFENLNSSEWLLYISEWTYNNQQISNIRVTTKVAVHSLLSDLEALQERGSAILYNMACKEVKSVVFDDVAVELTMAILQFFNNKPSEELLWRGMKSLAKFTEISGQEVPQLIQMIGPDPKTFKGSSERVDAQIEIICKKMKN